MMHWYNAQYLGMHFFWWIIWIVLLIWIFAAPWNIPGQRHKKDTPLDILRKRFANGEIDQAEYESRKKILENNG